MSHQQVRKDLNVNNPVQAKRSSGVEDAPPLPRTPLVRSSTRYGVVGKEGASFNPALRFACTGLFIFALFESLFIFRYNKRSFKIVIFINIQFMNKNAQM